MVFRPNYDSSAVTHLIYYVIHMLIRLLYNCMALIQEVTELVGCKTILRYKYFKRSLDFLNSNTGLLAKRPKHLALIVGDETISLPDLSQMLVWCQILKIEAVSLFDFQGQIKSNLALIINEFENLRRHAKELLKDNYQGYNMKINAYRCCDGKDAICNLTRDLCLRGVQHCEVTTDLVDLELKKMLDIDHDPELGIVFGSVMCLYGFLPWQIRLTEFFRLRTHKSLCVQRFFEMFTKFEKCQQRFGK